MCRLSMCSFDLQSVTILCHCCQHQRIQLHNDTRILYNSCSYLMSYCVILIHAHCTRSHTHTHTQALICAKFTRPTTKFGGYCTSIHTQAEKTENNIQLVNVLVVAVVSSFNIHFCCSNGRILYSSFISTSVLLGRIKEKDTHKRHFAEQESVYFSQF